MQVWCIMSESPAKTFMDVSASSQWGAGASDRPPTYKVTRSWTRARISFDDCLIAMHRLDLTFHSDSHVLPSNSAEELVQGLR